MSEINTNDLNEGIEESVYDATVITVPIDDTLSASGEAADAKAVGDALALKADKSELSAQVKVNGQSADQQGLIIVDGSDIEVSGTDTRTIAAAIAAADAKTGEDIRIGPDPGALTIAQAIEDGLNVTAEEIPLAEGEETTVADELARLDEAKGGVKTVNGKSPTANGNVQVEEVAYSRNLVSETARASAGTFTVRTSSGSASITSGIAYLQQMRGNAVHNGIVREVLEWDVNESGSGITAVLDRDTFLENVTESAVITLTYTTGWSDDPADYGITVTGTPASGDSIVINYVKEDRGHIDVATPTAFKATGWNLYNHSAGYAYVVAYDYAYHVGGSYSLLQYSATVGGNRSAITVVDGSFTVPADGYVWVTDGDSADTYITPEWTDWTDGTTENFAAYTENTIDLATLMGECFPDGLMAVGTTYDEIDIEMGQAISRIEKQEYNATNVAAAIASGRPWDADEDFIYIVRATPTVTAISVDGTYTVNDHGLEIVSGTDVGVYCLILYGSNLKNKLERDVLTLSQQTLTAAQKAQVLANIGAASADTWNAYSSGTMLRQTSAITSNYANYVRIGRMVIVAIDLTVDSAITTSTALYTVPAGLRPADTVSAVFGKLNRNGTDNYSLNHLKIESNGSLHQSMSSSWSTGSIQGIFVYQI